MTKYGGRVLHSRRDDMGLIEVVETHGIRSLHFGTPARQSCLCLATPERLELPYLRAMLIGLAFVATPRRILLLGLGGGSLAGFLLAHCRGASIEAVELRPAMIEIAREYFGLPESSRLRIRIADAGEYINVLAARGERDFDLILVDAFDDQGVAPFVMQHDFFSAAATCLAPGGVFSVNLWSAHAESFRAVMRLVKLYFPCAAHALPVMGRGNVIGVGLRSGGPPIRFREALAAAQRLQPSLGIEFTRLLQRLAPPWPR